MKVLIQRVLSASVEIEGKEYSRIGQGLLLFVGIGIGDGEQEVKILTDKTLNLRIFDDNQGKMNLSLIDISGEILVIPQFTLMADPRRGRRPSYSDSAPPSIAKPLFEKFVEECRKSGLKIGTGVFGANMKIFLINDGPVTIVLDSEIFKQPRND